MEARSLTAPRPPRVETERFTPAAIQRPGPQPSWPDDWRL